MIKDLRKDRVRLRRRLSKKFSSINKVSVRYNPISLSRDELILDIKLSIDITEKKEEYFTEYFLKSLNADDEIRVDVFYEKPGEGNYEISLFKNEKYIDICLLRLQSIMEFILEVIPELDKVYSEILYEKNQI